MFKKVFHSEKWLSFIRNEECWNCNAPSRNDPHHVGDGIHTRKQNDYLTLPLCRRCHDEIDGNAEFPRERLFEAIKGYVIKGLGRGLSVPASVMKLLRIKI